MNKFESNESMLSRYFLCKKCKLSFFAQYRYAKS